jgi:hypothetical protein
LESRWITGKDLVLRWKIKDFEIVEYVIQGLQPYNDIMKPIIPPGVAKWTDIIREHREDIADIEEQFPEFKNKYRTIDWWCELNIDTKDDSTGKYKKIDYPDGSDTDIRAEYESKRTEIEILEAKLNQYPDLPSWKGYELPGRSKDIRAVVSNLLDSLFEIDDILQLEKAITCEDSSSNKSVLMDDLTQKERDKVVENAFIKRGYVWEI